MHTENQSKAQVATRAKEEQEQEMLSTMAQSRQSCSHGMEDIRKANMKA